ncbi:hypothetical protein [Candidatus Poriferisodalis sp.]
MSVDAAGGWSAYGGVGGGLEDLEAFGSEDLVEGVDEEQQVVAAQ